MQWRKWLASNNRLLASLSKDLLEMQPTELVEKESCFVILHITVVASSYSRVLIELKFGLRG